MRYVVGTGGSFVGVMLGLVAVISCGGLLMPSLLGTDSLALTVAALVLFGSRFLYTAERGKTWSLLRFVMVGAAGMGGALLVLEALLAVFVAGDSIRSAGFIGTTIVNAFLGCACGFGYWAANGLIPYPHED